MVKKFMWLACFYWRLIRSLGESITLIVENTCMPYSQNRWYILCSLEYCTIQGHLAPDASINSYYAALSFGNSTFIVCMHIISQEIVFILLFSILINVISAIWFILSAGTCCGGSDACLEQCHEKRGS